MEIGERIAVVADQHAGAAARAAWAEHGDNRRQHLGDNCDALGLRLGNGVAHLLGMEGGASQQKADGNKNHTNPKRKRGMFLALAGDSGCCGY